MAHKNGLDLFINVLAGFEKMNFPKKKLGSIRFTLNK